MDNKFKFYFLFFFLLTGMWSCSMFKNVHKINVVDAKGSASDYLEALLNFEPWAESVWHDYPALPHSGYFGDGNSYGNGGIRGTCGIALSYAVLVRAQPQSPKHQNRLKRIEETLHYAAQTHESGPDSVLTVDGKKWGVTGKSDIDEGKGWQSSMWAASLGFTAALVENEINPQVVSECKRVVAVEANWLSKKTPPSGYEYDSKAEENAWQSNIVSLAAAWMPNNPNARKWLNMAKLYLANTYTVPSDTSGALSDWIETQTLFSSYALENHGFYHPTYQMVAGMSLGDSYLMAKMINPRVAQELAPFAEHNVLPVWEFMKPLVLDSGELAYPSGLDWSLHDFEHISYLSWLATHFKAPVAQWAEPRLAKQILYRQKINGDGRFVGESCPDGFYREAVEARRVAMAYLQDAIGDFPEAEGHAPKNGIYHYRDVGLIMQRSDNALTTVSYGQRTLSLVYPLHGKNAAQRFLISPNTSTLIGPGAKNKLLQFTKTANGFQAEILQNRNGNKKRIIIDSKPHAVVYINIPIKVTADSSEKWLLTAIENDPLTGGKRTVYWDEDSLLIKERSGVSSFKGSNWINLDNWMGFVTIPEGNITYQAAKKYNRNGGAEDYIYYQQEDAFLPHAVIVLPGENAEVTKKVQNSVEWKADKGNYILSFQSPEGENREIIVKVNKNIILGAFLFLLKK